MEVFNLFFLNSHRLKNYLLNTWYFLPYLRFYLYHKGNSQLCINLFLQNVSNSFYPIPELITPHFKSCSLLVYFVVRKGKLLPWLFLLKCVAILVIFFSVTWILESANKFCLKFYWGFYGYYMALTGNFGRSDFLVLRLLAF